MIHSLRGNSSISSRSIIRKYVTKADNYHEHAAKPSDTLAVVVYIADIELSLIHI